MATEALWWANFKLSYFRNNNISLQFIQPCQMNKVISGEQQYYIKPTTEIYNKFFSYIFTELLP